MAHDHRTHADYATRRAPDQRSGVVGLFVDRPVLTTMASLAIVVVGIIALTRLPLRLAPEGISADSINLWVPIREEMPPREVEERIVQPLEELLRTIPGVKSIDARASSGTAFCSIQLENGMDPMLASAEVRDRVQRAQLQWPAEVDRYFTWREDPNSAPLAFFQIQTPGRDATWDNKLDQVVRVRLEAVDGVGRVEFWGLLDETLRIWFDRDKLVEHRVDYGALLRRLSQDNFTQPVGELDDGSSRYMVRVDSKFRDREEIASYPIRPGLTIGDIARVEMVPSVRDSLARFDRKYTYTAVLRLAAAVNPVDASRNVRAALAELEQDPELAGVGFRFLFDQGQMIEDSLQTLLETSLQGGALALIALFLFLRNVKLTLAVALAIPMALMIATGWLFFTGMSLNIVTMASLTLSVGMVVDNSVVVLENIRRRRAEGLSLRESCVFGTREMVLAITMATLTTVVVFMPLVFMSTDTNLKTLFGALGMPLSIALLGSLLVALLLLPAAMRQVGCGRVVPGEDTGRVDYRTPIGWVLWCNERLLGFALRNAWTRALAFAGLFVVLGTIAVPAKGLDFSMGGGGGPFRGGDSRISLEIPRGRTLADVAALVGEYENLLLDRGKDEWGVEHVAVRFDRTSARFDIMYRDDVPETEFEKRKQAILAAWPREPGVQITLRDSGGRGGGGGGGMGGGSAEDDARNFVLRIWGPDSDFLAAKALEVRDRLAAMPEVVRAELGESEGNEQVVVRVDRDRMNDLGVLPESLERTMASGLRGMELTRFEEDDREVRLIAQFDAERNPTLFDLRETQVFNRRGSFQRVEDVSEIRFERSLETIRREDGKTHVSIVGERADGVSTRDFSELLRNVMGSTYLPRGYSWSEASRTTEVRAQLAQLADAGLLGVVLVFLLMAILFESLVLPASIIVLVLFAGLGGLWSLYLFHDGIDVMAGIGIVLLAGVVVNNGIVLLDCIERLRRDGMPRKEAIMTGMRLRLRPIMMTATTTIVGLLPMALFGKTTDGEGISYVGMSIAVAGGLALCTVFTTLAVPVFYTFADDFQRLVFGATRVGYRMVRKLGSGFARGWSAT
ncbi:MAG: efflux RND transporter permease subunit [Planctomycetes bacterium]|nr:efflux RND transporter permease subunit [Planctomycetota bacterium]